MRRLTRGLLTAMAASLALAAPAGAEFGFSEFDATFTGPDGAIATQAGSHPYAFTTSLEVSSEETPVGSLPEELLKDLEIRQAPGFIGDQTYPRCASLNFLEKVGGDGTLGNSNATRCSDATTVGWARISAGEGDRVAEFTTPVYNLAPAPGKAAKLGFWVLFIPVTIEVGLNESPPYNLVASLNHISQTLEFVASDFTLWGVPSDPRHDRQRGFCLQEGGEIKAGGKACSAGIPPRPFLTLPRACRGPLLTEYEADSWENPGAFVGGSFFTHDEAIPPNPQGMGGCSKLAFSPSITAQPTSKAASSPTGLDFSLDVADEGLSNAEGLAASDIEKAVVTLPEGFSANPSLAEGLEVCTEAQLASETVRSVPGTGCPNASKIGSVTVESPLVEEKVNGALYIAKPYENPFDSLLALYIVIKNPTLGIIVRQPLEVIPDPVTGQLTTVAEELPQLPFSHFKLHFREGARSPLATPQACGTYNAKAVLTPWSGQPPITTNSAFQIITGPNEGPCPTGGLPPFKPGLLAGTINNRAGSFSPFYLRMFRSDSEQEVTHFSIKLPPGITGKLAGIPYCSDQAIAAAKARTGPHGGQEELDNPSCPAASEIGRTLAGAGVGPSLTYAPGKVYLAGPYHGSNLSMVAITAGKVGPFDIGTVVIRQAFKIDPETAEVFIDSTGSDPIPHIIRGVPVHLRDIRAYVDRPEFVLNPTDCTATSTASTVLGSGLDFVSDADDNPITVTSRFQAADCAALPFKPQLSIRLIGGTKRGAHPKFTAHLAMNGIGESGIAKAQVVLPKSEYIANENFKTICTRVQFKEGAGNGAGCPAGSIYGKAKAVTPLLAEPLEGPVFLRANGGERNLPDLVVALHNSQVDFDLVGYVDSVNGRLRNTFETAPDAPVTSFDIELEGNSKGLFENSVNLCAKKHFATANFTGQNGKAYSAKPVLKVKCKGKASKKAKRHKRHKRSAGR